MALKKQEPDGTAELKRALKEKNPGRLYVFYGEEAYLKRYYLEALKKLLTDGPAEEFNYHRFTNENMSVNALSDAVEALPMMAERTFLQVDDYELFKAGESDREKLTQLLTDLPGYCCLVFYYSAAEFKPDKRQKKLYEALTANGTLVEFRKQSGRELSAWIRRHFLKHQQDIDETLCQYLIYVTGGSMDALGSEIEKISAYADGPAIRKTDIDSVVEPVLDAVVFDITEAIAAGSYDKALQKLSTVLKMQEDPIMVLGAVGAQMRRLRCARVLMAAGKGGDSLMKLCGLSDYPARKTMTAAGRVSLRFCDRAVVLCEQADFRMKTSYDDPERILELLLVTLSQEAKHG